MFRTHTCGELRGSHAGQIVTLCGWVDRTRDHKGVLFVDLRDRYGKTQVVFDPDDGKENFEIAQSLAVEYVIQVTGKIVLRPEGTGNAKLATGEIELHCQQVKLLNTSLNPPFQPGSDQLPNEELRLKYRYLDLRRPEMQRTLVVRHQMIKEMRDYFDQHDFIEVETPMLGRSTPEGARDYLVPSRIQHGSFYALPQSPQLYKQILMVAGYDRYVQVARCFRDEDLRADRQPEFTQLDLEMSFVDGNDIMGMIEGLLQRVVKRILGVDIKLPLPRMCYDEAMGRFGHDAPDLRFGMELVDLTNIAKQVEFRVFRGAADSGGFVRGLNAKGAAGQFSRKDIDELTQQVIKNSGAKGLAWFKVEDAGTLASPIAKNFTPEQLTQIAQRMTAAPGDLLLMVADEWDVTCKALYGVRKRLGEQLKLYEPTALHCSWVVEFPMFAFDKEENRWAAMHHPFTACRPQDIELLKTDPAAARAQAYDLVINGSEAGGGTVRIHDQQMQQEVFTLLGITPEQARERFGFLLDALQYGAPPHAGIALGLDRWVMLLTGLTNIRDCIAFPKTQKATDLMTEAPGPVDARQLKELGIKMA